MNYRYSTLHSTLPEFNVNKKRIIVRADCNVPLKNGKIENDFRLRALLPTLQFIAQRGGKIILITHLGRPQHQEPALSTQQLVSWFEQQGFSVRFAATVQRAHELSNESNSSLVLLENVRFFPGETTHDNNFAQQLAQCGDFYINDAFATVHRDQSSLTLTPLFFPREKRSIGFLIEREIHALNRLINSPEQPFLVLCGGGKIETKIPLIASLLDQDATIALLPATVFTFLKAEGHEVGASLVETDQLSSVHALLAQTKYKNKFIFPADYLVAPTITDATWNLSFVPAAQFPKNYYGISIGPHTVNTLKKYIEQAQTIFFNAAVGFPQHPETVEPINELLKAIGNSHAYSVIGGGDSVSFAVKAGVADQIGFLSTGGGATLAYVGKQPLPGLDPFLTQSDKS
ncbi:MAG: Phosphoglycerate kinase [Candidatus Dependentiae bacterium ADurb.Bin331]|nr:MAG: Phosphoglycerate kinase [Candidatus Dependentiae bacterium ADurb.Bin331]